MATQSWRWSVGTYIVHIDNILLSTAYANRMNDKHFFMSSIICVRILFAHYLLTVREQSGLSGLYF